MIKPIYLTLDNISRFGICGPGVSEAALEKLTGAVGIDPLGGQSQSLSVDLRASLFDAYQVRIAWEAEYGTPTSHRQQIPGSKEAQRRAAPQVKQVKQVKQQPIVMRVCEFCQKEFEVPYGVRGLSARKTCGAVCLAAFISANSKAGRAPIFTFTHAGQLLNAARNGAKT